MFNAWGSAITMLNTPAPEPEAKYIPGFSKAHDVKRMMANRNRDKILAYLVEFGPANVSKLKHELGICKTSVRDHLCALEEEGEVEREGNGAYVIWRAL